MLSKMTMTFGDELGAIIRGGSIVRWHKREGDWIHYGDSLFDLKVEEVAVPRQLQETAERFATANFDARGVAKLAAEQLEAQDFEIDQFGDDGPEARQNKVFLIRVTSSDKGRLAKICAGVHEPRGYGDVLALVSSDGESVDGLDDEALDRTTTFRVVTNAFEDVAPAPVETLAETPEEAPGAAPAGREHAGRNHILFWSGRSADKRAGIYATGSYFLLPVFAAKQGLQDRADTRWCIIRDNGLDLRSDLLLELSRGPNPARDAMLEKMGLGPDHLRCRIFDPEFEVDGPSGPERFPTRAVFLSVGPDVTRVIFRHREHGFLLDPGRRWLNRRLSASLDRMAAPMPWSTAKQLADEELPWFRGEFESAGAVTVEDFYENMRQLIPLIRERAGAHVVLVNILASGPEDPAHNLQFVDEPRRYRRLAFNVAAAELSHALDAPVLDLDRVLKRHGIRRQVDWDILDPTLYPEVGREVVGILADLGIA